MNYDHFIDLKAVQQELHQHVMAYRSELADKLRMLATDYELQTLSATDATRQAWLEGVAEGLRTAAAELDPERVRV